MIIYLLALTAHEPLPFSMTHYRDIDCVALLGLLAEEQRQGPDDDSVPNIEEQGKVYAGIVGSRIVEETGLPKESVGSAIWRAVDNARTLSLQSAEGKAEVRAKTLQCLPLMETDLRANAATPTIIITKNDFFAAADGRRILVVSGRVVNQSAQPVERPEVMVELKDALGRVVFQSKLDLKPGRMSPDEFTEFSQAFADMPQSAAAVTLSWAK